MSNSIPSVSAFAPARVAAEPTDSALLREISADIRSLTDRHGRDAVAVGGQLARVEEGLESVRARPLALAGLAAFTAMLGFLATILLLQVGRRTAAVSRDVTVLADLVERSRPVMDAAFERIEGRLSEQSAAVDHIAVTVGGMQAAADRTAAVLSGLGRDVAAQGEVAGRMSRQLTDAALETSALRRAMEERFTRERELAAQERAETLESVTAAITRVERVLTDQAVELRVQREQLDASARRLTDARRQALAEATTAVGMKLDGLRQILDGLRTEAESSGDAPPVNAASTPADVTTPAETAARAVANGGESPAPAGAAPETDLSTAGPVEAGRPAVPEVAGRPEDDIVE